VSADVAEAAAEETRSATTERRLRRISRYVGVPLLVAIACGATYLYVQSRQLDSIEARLINLDDIIVLGRQQLVISLWATALTLVVAIPLGIALTRPWARRITPYVVAAANIGQGIPAIGLIVIVFVVWLRDGRNAGIIALAIYALLPVLRGTLVGLQQVDRDVIKAARGMGMSKSSVLFRVELPLAVPILLTGVRTALVLTVATSVLVTFIGGGTYGQMIQGGFAQGRNLAVIVGGVAAASMAVIADWVAGIAEDFLRPRGL
jgi:osmoprotectant transport system permease protein